MCGFSGFFSAVDIGSTEHVTALLQAMGNTIAHRGPDDAGIWSDRAGGIGLVHRRLAILDLTPAGHQPMSSASGRHVIAFNGEIYNHLHLRGALERAGHAPAWRGHSDTETLLAGIEAWGLEGTLKRAVGMFALAVWDRERRSLHLARDRFGEKPLYYGWQRGVFLFGSELKALKAHPAFCGEIDRNAIALQLRHNYIPAPHTIYRDVFKLTPGCILNIGASDTASRASVPPVPYWSFADVATNETGAPFAGDDAAAVKALDEVLRSAVQQQMLSDVPLGAFLSGGVDSSTIVAMMQAQSAKPVKTFSIGFNEAGYDEAQHAKAVARHLRTDHTELYVTSDQAMAVIPRLPALYDEPFSDSSQIPTFLVSELTRQHVTVSLSGDAGDELFGGYGRYFLTDRIWSKLSLIPRHARGLIASAITEISPQRWNRLSAPLMGFLPPSRHGRNIGDKLHKGAAVLKCKDMDALYRKLVSHWNAPDSVVIGAIEPASQIDELRTTLATLGGIERMMATDTLTYLPGDILAKVDRAAMGVSLETRVPFLDHRVVEYAWRLPMSMKLRNGQGKWILRQVLYKYVPKELIERPKMGFGVPIDSWLREPLRDWAENLLDESRLRREGFFNPAPIRQKWIEHLSGKRNWQYHLWDVLMFQAWLEHDSVSIAGRGSH